MYEVLCTIYRVQCITYGELYAICSVQCTVCDVICTMYHVLATFTVYIQIPCSILITRPNLSPIGTTFAKSLFTRAWINVNSRHGLPGIVYPVFIVSNSWCSVLWIYIYNIHYTLYTVQCIL